VKNVAAKKLVVLIPRMMRLIRSEMRTLAGDTLSVPQFRVLANIRAGTTTTTAIAELHGISIPAVSKLVDGLVKRDLVERLPQAGDRRVIKLGLSGSGKKLLEKISGNVEKKLEQALERLPDAQCQELVNGLHVLESFLG
jgi:DNA-binding MarR family transcriptional regulator